MRRTLKTITLTGVLALGVLRVADPTTAKAQLFGISVPGFNMTIGGPGYYGGYYGGYPGVYGYGVPYGGYGVPYTGYYGAGYGVPYYGNYYGGYPGIGITSYRTYGYGYRPFGYGYHRGYYGHRRFGW
jgi:hypothetical protein